MVRFANLELPEDTVTEVTFRVAEIAVLFVEELRVTVPENPVDITTIVEKLVLAAVRGPTVEGIEVIEKSDCE